MFQAGDAVRVRSWDDMKAEFGLGFNGDIACRYFFTPSMKRFCGEIYHISNVAPIMPDERDTEVWLKERPMFFNNSRAYVWCAGMLEFADKNKNISIDNITAFI